MSLKSPKISSTFLLTILFLLLGYSSKAQLYSHNFGTTTISSHPYTTAPQIINPNLSNSSWSNSLNAWTSTTGSAGQAIRLTTSVDATISLSLNVGANYKADITSFSFWSQRSNAGPSNWSMAINGTTVGSGIIGTNATPTGNIPVSNPIVGLTGTINVVISLTGGTGNGTFRLDDFVLNGFMSLNCTAATISSIVPLTGPQNTLVTITGSGFQAGAGTSAVQFNGIPSSYTVLSDTEIEAYVPAGNASGNITVITGGCPSVSTASFVKIVSDIATNYSSDIYISEIHDVGTTGDGGIGGSGGIIEIYNGTASTVNLAGYSVKRYGDIGDANPSITPLNLVGSIPPGGIFILGLGSTRCTVPYNQTYNTGFNENDEMELLKNGVVIDNVHMVFALSGYTLIRKPDAVAPKAVFNANDWTGFTLEKCDNIGIHNVSIPPLPTITHPTSKTVCENGQAIFSATLSAPAGYLFQWKTLNASGNWVNINNNAQFSGATTNTLTINSVPLSLDKSQYYCQMTSSSKTLYSNAAQLRVTTSITPDFPTSLTFCNGDTASALATTSPNGISGTWSPATINTALGGTYTFTPNAGQCASNVILTVNITAKTVPNFPTVLAVCNGDTAPVLATTSPNGITGTWSPATINNTTPGTYTFTPNAGQCAANAVLNVTITARTIPNFAPISAICSGDTAPILAATSPNGIIGTWSPATINNTAPGTYTFTPNAGQCATNAVLNVAINPRITPDFDTTKIICNGSVAPILATTSPNGISGTWSPATVSNTADGVYTFTPASGQCATNAVLRVTVTNSITPDFPTTLSVCNGDTAPVLGMTSPNGITGTWSPATINNTTPGTYTFTPNAGQCAVNAILNVTITPRVVPNFPTVLAVCNGDTAPVLATTSPNGISGTWAPAIINNTTPGTYTFTPIAGQCATNAILNVTITPRTIPNFASISAICSGDTAPILATTSPNGIIGTWSPAIVSNTTPGTYTFTPNAGQCATNAGLNVAITPRITPDFAPISAICSGDTAPILAATSPNGITGTWSPAIINNTTPGIYTFTPNAGQCATNAVLNVTITPRITPDFPATLVICNGGTTPVLATTSPNGISGTWSPSTVSNTADGVYTFTPASGQCATNAVLRVTVTNSITPDFPTTLSVCNGNTVPILAGTSPNGISGIWSPATISNTTPGTYTFTPNAGQCAANAVLNVAITPRTVPNFPTVLAVCNGDTAPVLVTTSPNGISGTWSPAIINNTTPGTYTFTPNAGQCATNAILNVTITPRILPDFQTSLAVCNGSTAPILATISPNGIIGTWSTATISNTTPGTYIFTPNAGQCATNAVLNVTITPRVIPDFATTLTICSGDPVSPLSTVAPNGITGIWNPSTINNTINGRYTFTPNSGQCASPMTLDVFINNGTLAPISGPNNLCETNTIQLTNATPAGIWSSSNTSIATVDNTGIVTGITAGTAIITYSLTIGSCTAKAIKTIVVNAPPKPSLKDKFICIDPATGTVISNAVLNSGVPNANHSFIWTLGSQVLSTLGNTHNAVQAGVYNVVATDLTTGCSSSASAVVEVSSMAIATATVAEDFERNQTITINVTGGSGEYEFQLNDGLPQESNQFTGVFSGEYEIIVRDKNGCRELILEVFALNYPRYFTPNGDGYHDTWNINSLSNQAEAKIYIFDRYGKLLKNITPSTSGWNGTYNGQLLPSTDYWFTLMYKGRDGNDKEFKSHFSMKR